MEDVLIIGAGPSGLSCARHLKNYGISAKILEEHQKIGLPIQCSGLVSWNLKKFTEIDESFLERKIYKARIHSPSGFEIELKKKKPVFVINRHRFDRYLSKNLEDIVLGVKVNSLSFKNDSVSVKTNKGEFRARMVVGADGPNSVVAKHFQVTPQRSMGLMTIVNENPKNNFVELFYDRKETENFLWKIPRKNCVEYGIMGENCKAAQLKSFFNLRECRTSGGLIPIKSAKKTYFDRCLLLGDAAGQVKPWSGGGVVYSLLCSKIAAGVISEAFQENDFSEKTLRKYEIRWKGTIGKQIFIGNLWNKFLDKSNNYILDLFFHSLKLIKLDWLDMDFIK